MTNKQKEQSYTFGCMATKNVKANGAQVLSENDNYFIQKSENDQMV